MNHPETLQAQVESSLKGYLAELLLSINKNMSFDETANVVYDFFTDHSEILPISANPRLARLSLGYISFQMNLRHNILAAFSEEPVSIRNVIREVFSFVTDPDRQSKLATKVEERMIAVSEDDGAASMI